MRGQPILLWIGCAEAEHDGQLYATGLAIVGAKVVIVVLPLAAGARVPA